MALSIFFKVNQIEFNIYKNGKIKISRQGL
jgi:hypothetical protein